MSRAARVLLMGAYGQDNLGDEAILEVHLQQLAGRDVTVVSSDPAQTSARYGVPSVRTYGPGWRARLRAFAATDAVVYGGGSLLKELPPPHFRQRLVANLAAATLAGRVGGKRVAFSAMGVERLDSRRARLLARVAAGASHLVLVRDEGSRRKLRAAGARREPIVTADPAYLLDVDARAEARAEEVVASLPPGPVVVANAMTSREVRRDAAAVAEAFAALVDHLHETSGASVLLLPFKTRGEDNDVDVLSDVAARARRASRVRLAPLDLRPSDVLALLRRAELVVAMRHHAVLLGLAARRPVLPVPYAEKTTNLCEEFGLEPFALDADRLAPAALVAAFERAHVARKQLVDAQARPLAAMKARAQDNFERLRALVDGGA